MRALLKNNVLRLMQERANVFVYLILTVLSMIAAVYISSRPVSFAHIAVLDKDQALVQDIPGLRVSIVKEEVPMSVLIRQKYDAYVSYDQGSVKITSVKSDAFQSQLKELLVKHHLPASLSQARGRGTTIVGFAIMFIMMQAMTYMLLYGEDKEQHCMERVLISPVGFFTYHAAQILFSVFFTLLPAYLTICVMSLLGYAIGFTLLEYAGLLFLLSLFATSLSLCIQTLIKEKDTATMLGSALIVLTSIISGSFTSFTREGSFLDTLSHFLPQHFYLDIASDLEQHQFSMQTAGSLLVFLLLSAILFGTALYSNRKRFTH